jgi:hypothetical protein
MTGSAQHQNQTPQARCSSQGDTHRHLHPGGPTRDLRHRRRRHPEPQPRGR